MLDLAMYYVDCTRRFWKIQKRSLVPRASPT